jgi:hypothetical protein
MTWVRGVLSEKKGRAEVAIVKCLFCEYRCLKLDVGPEVQGSYCYYKGSSKA